MPMTSQEMIKYLKKNGFETVSQNGSHVKMRNTDTEKTVIVPYHSKDLKKGLEQAILKQAGLKQPSHLKYGGMLYEKIILPCNFSQGR